MTTDNGGPERPKPNTGKAKAAKKKVTSWPENIRKILTSFDLLCFDFGNFGKFQMSFGTQPLLRNVKGSLQIGCALKRTNKLRFLALFIFATVETRLIG